MRWIYLLVLSVHASAAPVLWLPIQDTINPGTADAIRTTIAQAEEDEATVVIVLDTPGGLLSSTREIVQAMLNSTAPIVVFIAPKGAQAGSAGALITLAADVAVMAPGSNIGAAHPVAAGGEKIDGPLKDKLANDTAAFAESLAKTKGRNTDWAKKAVTQSASIIAEEALRLGVIDFIAEDESSLLQKLKGYPLRVPKKTLKSLPNASFEITRLEPSIRQKLVSFFANPTVAYLIMTLGTVCLWIELTHPGMILPGVVGAIAILISLVSFQLMPISYGALALIFAGLAMLVAELFVPSFGSLGFGGIVAFILGSVYLLDPTDTSHPLSLTLILPIATLLCALVGILSYLVSRSQRSKVQTGLESLVGAVGEARMEFQNGEGKVFVQGELWQAQLVDATEKVGKGQLVLVKGVDRMTLLVSKKEPRHV